MTGRGLRVIFMGTPDFVVPTLEALVKAHDVVAVYTQPPRAQGRGKSVIEKSAVHKAAEQHGVPVVTPENFKDVADVDDFRRYNADIAVVAAYGMLLPQDILDAPQHGCINVHPSLLPRWRGTSPIQFAIWKGDEHTGVSVMKLVKKMDAGPVIAQEGCAVGDHDFTSLNTMLWQAGTRLVLQALDELARTGNLKATAQSEEGVTFTHMLEKDHGRINWTQNAFQIDRQVRALNPRPGTWCMVGGKRFKILALIKGAGMGTPGEVLSDHGDVACDGGAVRLVTIQPEGKKPMDAIAAFNGGYLKVGERLL